jgi:LemA protein
MDTNTTPAAQGAANAVTNFIKTPVGIIVGLALLAVLFVGGKYNSLVTMNEGVTGQWAQVETQYQRRFDLIPNLVSSVQGAMKQEQAVFGQLAEARSKYAGAATPDQKAEAAGQVESAFARLLVVMENYPQLKSIETVQGLMAELAGTENRVAVERGRYNEAVRDYNVAVKTFPGSLISSLFGFAPRTMFEAAQGAENAPKVQF